MLAKACITIGYTYGLKLMFGLPHFCGKDHIHLRKKCLEHGGMGTGNHIACQVVTLTFLPVMALNTTANNILKTYFNMVTLTHNMND